MSMRECAASAGNGESGGLRLGRTICAQHPLPHGPVIRHHGQQNPHRGIVKLTQVGDN